MIQISYSEFWHPLSLIKNWNENDWSMRLKRGINKSFHVHAVFTGTQSCFVNYLPVSYSMNIIINPSISVSYNMSIIAIKPSISDTRCHMP